jgi:hypothetical protein
MIIVHMVSAVLLMLLVNDVDGVGVDGTEKTNVTSKSSAVEIRPEIEAGNTSNQRTHSDLIKSCSTFRDIFSAEMAYSCDYSMLYYKGKCEQYSSLLKKNETETKLEAKIDLSFCLDPRVDNYIQEHGLTDAPRSPTLVPGYDSPIA